MKRILLTFALLLCALPVFAGCTDSGAADETAASSDMQPLIADIDAALTDIDDLFADFEDDIFMDVD